MADLPGANSVPGLSFVEQKTQDFDMISASRVALTVRLVVSVSLTEIIGMREGQAV